jgi:hypothetical protein
MTSRRWSVFVVLAALSFSGCRMCCPSYDYCSPVEPGMSNSEDCGMHRRGSIFTNAPVYQEGEFVEGETIIEEQAEPVMLQPPAPPSIPSPPPSPPTLPSVPKQTRRTR